MFILNCALFVQSHNMRGKQKMGGFIAITYFAALVALGNCQSSVWSIPPGTEFIGYNITPRSQPSFAPDFKDRPSTYIDFSTRLRTGILRQFQYYIDTGGISVSPVFVRFQIWKVLGTNYVDGVVTNYMVSLVYEQREQLGTADGIYTVDVTGSQVMVEDDWALGFAIEANTLPFTFDYTADANRESFIDLNVEPGAYSINSELQASTLDGENILNSYGVVIDPCSVWSNPPDAEFIGYNIISRSLPSFIPDFRNKPSTYIDFSTRLRTGVLRQFQYYIDTGGVSVSPIFVRFQIWKVLGTNFVGGVATNYTVSLVYEQREQLDTADGLYTVDVTGYQVAVEANWALGFAVEANTLPFTFDYTADANRETLIDLNVEPGTDLINSELPASTLDGENILNSYGVVIDPSTCGPSETTSPAGSGGSTGSTASTNLSSNSGTIGMSGQTGKTGPDEQTGTTVCTGLKEPTGASGETDLPGATEPTAVIGPSGGADAAGQTGLSHLLTTAATSLLIVLFK